MIPRGRQLPAASILMGGEIALRRVVAHNTAMLLLFMKSTHLLFYLQLFRLLLIGVLAAKRYVFCIE
jgi:hypothetical protein